MIARHRPDGSVGPRPDPTGAWPPLDPPGQLPERWRLIYRLAAIRCRLAAVRSRLAVIRYRREVAQELLGVARHRSEVAREGLARLRRPQDGTAA